MLPAQPPQDPWLLTFYTAPALERGFAAWHSARFAQVSILQSSAVLATHASEYHLLHGMLVGST